MPQTQSVVRPQNGNNVTLMSDKIVQAYAGCYRYRGISRAQLYRALTSQKFKNLATRIKQGHGASFGYSSCPSVTLVHSDTEDLKGFFHKAEGFTVTPLSDGIAIGCQVFRGEDGKRLIRYIRGYGKTSKYKQTQKAAAARKRARKAKKLSRPRS